MEDDLEDLFASIICPSCGGQILIPTTEIRFGGRYGCPHCKATIVVEGEKVKVEMN